MRHKVWWLLHRNDFLYRSSKHRSWISLLLKVLFRLSTVLWREVWGTVHHWQQFCQNSVLCHTLFNTLFTLPALLSLSQQLSGPLLSAVFRWWNRGSNNFPCDRLQWCYFNTFHSRKRKFVVVKIVLLMNKYLKLCGLKCTQVRLSFSKFLKVWLINAAQTNWPPVIAKKKLFPACLYCVSVTFLKCSSLHCTDRTPSLD